MNTEKLELLYKNLGYHFKNPHLLQEAMTHSSYCVSKQQNCHAHLNNERLEFLGDALLELAISEHLMTLYPHNREGSLSQMRSKLVNTDYLSLLAIKLGIVNLIQLGKGEQKSGGQYKKSILAGAFEALIAAIYLDQNKNFEIIQKLIQQLFEEKIKEFQNISSTLDFKGRLQQYSQQRFQELPVYRVINESGQDHDKVFEIAVFIQEKKYGQGSGKSKKEAEKSAAQKVLQQLEK